MSERVILWLIIVAYMAFIFIKGVSKAKDIEDTDDFLLAGRKVGWLFLFCTMGATVIGGGASIGAIGRTYDWGVLMLLVSTGWYIHFIFSGLVVAPRFRAARLYTVAGYFGHRFGEGPRRFILVLSLLFSVFIVAAQMAAFGHVLSAIIPDMANPQTAFRIAVLVGGSIVVIYSTAGGLMAVIHTDFYQFVILLVGFLVTLCFCVPDIVDSYDSESRTFLPNRFSIQDLRDADALASEAAAADDGVGLMLREQVPASGRARLDTPPASDEQMEERNRALVDGLNSLLENEQLHRGNWVSTTQISEQTRELLRNVDALSSRQTARLNLSLLQDAFPVGINPNRRLPARFFHVHGQKGWLFLVTTFLAFLLGETFAPGYATRYCVGKDVRETRLGIAGVGVFLACVFPVVLFFIALYARIHFPDIEPQQALPMVVRQLNNPVVGGLIIGALLMAVMSSADSALNSSTAIFVKDLFEHQLGWRDKGDGSMLKLARKCSAGLGIAAVIIAVLWSDIIGILLFTYHVWAPAVILPVCVGVLSKQSPRALTRRILTTMSVATAATMGYRLVLFCHGKEWWSPPAALAAVMEQVDASVFGVLVSCLAYGICCLVAGRSARGER